MLLQLLALVLVHCVAAWLVPPLSRGAYRTLLQLSLLGQGYKVYLHHGLPTFTCVYGGLQVMACMVGTLADGCSRVVRGRALGPGHTTLRRGRPRSGCGRR